MTKIKDLVTVTLDSVFSFFPIDSERYELTTSAIKYWEKCRNSVSAGFITSEDDRVNLALREIDITFLKCSESYIKCVRNPGLSHPGMDGDRARRVEASLSDIVCSPVLLFQVPKTRAVYGVRDLLWGVLIDRLQQEHTGRAIVP